MIKVVEQVAGLSLVEEQRGNGARDDQPCGRVEFSLGDAALNDAAEEPAVPEHDVLPPEIAHLGKLWHLRVRQPGDPDHVLAVKCLHHPMDHKAKQL